MQLVTDQGTSDNSNAIKILSLGKKIELLVPKGQKTRSSKNTEEDRLETELDIRGCYEKFLYGCNT